MSTTFLNTAKSGGNTTIPLADAAVQASHPANFKPETIRLPKPGTLCPHSGLSRTVQYQLCKEGKIKSVVLRKRGSARGVRLIFYDSLISYLRSLEEEQNTQKGGQP